MFMTGVLCTVCDAQVYFIVSEKSILVKWEKWWMNTWEKSSAVNLKNATPQAQKKSKKWTLITMHFNSCDIKDRMWRVIF